MVFIRYLYYRVFSFKPASQCLNNPLSVWERGEVSQAADHLVFLASWHSGSGVSDTKLTKINAPQSGVSRDEGKG